MVMIVRRLPLQVSVEFHSVMFIVLMSSVPDPNVLVSLNTNDTVYQGTELVITCTVTVDSTVDTAYDINMTWSSDPAGVVDGSYFSISDITGSRQEYSSTVTISPVNTTDSANYTCTASVIATDSDYSMENSTVNITVEGIL